MAAVERLKVKAEYKSAVWEDTVAFDSLKMRKTVPSSVKRYAAECLAMVDVDTVSLKQSHSIAKALLVVDRDADVERMYKRLSDSIAADSSTLEFQNMMGVYLNATPVRMSKVHDLLQIGLANIHPDSVVNNLALRTIVGIMTVRYGDFKGGYKILQDALAVTDTLSPDIKSAPKYVGFIKGVMFPVIAPLMPQEAIDSLRRSTLSYEGYKRSLMKRMLPEVSENDLGAIGVKVPPLEGDYWYSNLSTPKAVAIDKQLIPEEGSVNILVFLQGGCHANYDYLPEGRYNGAPNSCWERAARLRRIQQLFPSVKITVVSETYGSVGDSKVMSPEEEAEVLAGFFLNFHQIKGVHVISKTDFIRMSGRDGRRIDTETENFLNYQFNHLNPSRGGILFVDEENRIFHIEGIEGVNEPLTNAKLEAVLSRPANATGAKR